MFESVKPDPGEEALKKASRLFLVLGVLIVISTALSFVFWLADRGRVSAVVVVVNPLFAIAAFVSASGIANHKVWAKWLGIVIGVFELANVPIGTVIGVAALIQLYRASSAGLLNE